MQSSFEIIGTAWTFYRKQPVLNQIAFWMFFVPIGALNAISGVIDTVTAQSINLNAETMDSLTAMEIAVSIPIIIGLMYIMVWGNACTLVVAKRLLTSSAGRTRSSFKAVRDQSKKFIIPLFLVGILRGVTTLLWSLLLIVPGVIYSVRTAFFDIMMIEKGKVVYGRQMLTKSTEFVKGRSWQTFGYMLTIGCLLFIPSALVGTGITATLTAVDARLENLAIILVNAIDAYVGMLFIVCMVALYAELKKTSSHTS